MVCRGCNEDKKLVKSHIIPESFFRNLRADEKTLRLISNTAGVYPKKAPIGVYDKDILCKECEDRFQVLDDYAARVLIDNPELSELKQNGDLIGYCLHNIDYKLLKLFVISLLWRASISGHSFYSKVNLGVFEERAKRLIWEAAPVGKDDFSFVLAKFDDEGTLSKAMLDPHPERWFGRRYYRFYIGGYVLYVKTDSQVTPDQWAPFIPFDSNLYVISRGRIKASKEFSVLISGFRKNL